MASNSKELYDAMKREKDMLLNKVSMLEKELQENNEDILNLNALISLLISKERTSTNELLDVHNALIKGFTSGVWGSRFLGFGVKRMGEIDENIIGEPMHSIWSDRLRNPLWYPFKVVEDGDGNCQEVVKEDDESLMELRSELGEDSYNAVVTAFKELNEYNPSGRFPVLELWNFQENRKACPEEVISSIFKQRVPAGAVMTDGLQAT